jgi:hypothetical protein
MCSCLFCGQEMEDEEKLVDFHICPPDQSISLNSVRVAMNEIFEKEEDGWSAWASLGDWLDKQSAQQSVQRTGTIVLDGTFACPECHFHEKHLASCSRR